jgi:predicted nucleic acid-binding protein
VQTGYQIYDALILAAALEEGCDTLYSEDMQDGQSVGAVTIRNPFADYATKTLKPPRGHKQR